jgi:hypothetical protein
MDHSRVSIFVNSSGNNYSIFTLFQTKRNPSLYLHLSEHHELKRSGLGKVTFEGHLGTQLTARIEYGNSEIFFKPIDHSSIHEDGRAHVKFTDKTYFSRTTGLPLKNLKIARHLWTIIPGSFKDKNIVTTLPKDHQILPIPDDDDVFAVVFVIFAVPKGGLKINFSFPVEYFKVDTGKFPINILPLDFNFYTVYLLTYSTLKFISPPPTTYAFPDFFNLAPFVTEMNEKYMELELKELISNKIDGSLEFASNRSE